MREAFALRLAKPGDIPALAGLISLSVHGLQADTYSSAQREAALGTAFGVDRQLISDGTYFVAEAPGAGIVGCGGWSRRQAEFGSDDFHAAGEALLDPARDSARVRAFFVRPDWARRGIGRAILDASEAAARAAGFREGILVATLAGVPLYAAGGWREAGRLEAPLPGGVLLPLVRMTKRLA